MYENRDIISLSERDLKKYKPTEELGSSSEATWLSYLVSDEYLQDWKILKKRVKIINKMLSDATLTALKRAITLPILSTEWTIEGPDDKLMKYIKDTKTFEEIIDFVEYNFLHMNTFSLKDFIREALESLFYGFYIFEIIYTKNEDKLVIQELSPRPPKTILTWKVNENGKIIGVIQQTFRMIGKPEEDYPDVKYIKVNIPLEKLIVFSFDKTGNNYEGNSILRGAYKHWKIKDFLYKVQAIAMERYSVGTPVIQFSQPPSDNDWEYAKKLLKKWRVYEDAGVILHPTMTMSNIMGTFNAGAIEMAIRHHDVMIAKSVLAQFLNLIQSGYGSRALSENQSDLFLLSLNYIADFIADTINKQLIPKLVDINYGKQIVYPKIKHGVIGDLHVESNMKFISMLMNLIQAGVVEFNDNIKDLIYKKLKLPLDKKEQALEVNQEKNDKKELPVEAKEKLLQNIMKEQMKGEKHNKEEKNTQLTEIENRPIPEFPLDPLLKKKEENKIYITDEDVAILLSELMQKEGYPISKAYAQVYFVDIVKDVVKDILNDNVILKEIENTLQLANPYKVVSSTSILNNLNDDNITDYDINRVKNRIYSPTQILRTGLQWGSVLAGSSIGRQLGYKYLAPKIKKLKLSPELAKGLLALGGGIAGSLAWGLMNNLFQYGELAYLLGKKKKREKDKINNYYSIKYNPYLIKNKIKRNKKRSK